MPQDIGPEISMANTRSHHGCLSKRDQEARAQTDKGSRKSTEHQISNAHDDGEYQIELLEYEWPDLPPIMDLKDAVCRKRVSLGINYLLPVDKGKNSIDSKFRTDLRAMFQEPYATEGFNYDENRITRSAKIHFNTNAVDTKWTRSHLINIPVCLNSESENIRKLYAHSAPAGGRSRTGMKVDKLKTRSSLFLPIKTRDQPEAQKLRKEVEEIIKSVQEDNDEYNENREKTSTKEKSEKFDKRKTVSAHNASIIEQTNNSHEADNNKEKFTAAKFVCYDQVKHAKPPKLCIPEQFKSEFLSNEKNQEIWEWLHYGESITDFEYFLTICG